MIEPKADQRGRDGSRRHELELLHGCDGGANEEIHTNPV